MYKIATTNNDNRRQFVIQNHHVTYQRKGNHELQIPALNIIVTEMQNHINNLSSSSGGGGEIGTMSILFLKEHVIYFIYKYKYKYMYIYIYIYKYMELVFVYITRVN